MLAQAWTEDDDVCIEFTAVQDERAQQYFNISTQSSDVRKEFRTKHTDGTYYGSSGYTYESGDWKTIKGAGKMLLLTYRYSGSDGSWQGYQYRTVRNGYTVTIDYKVLGRSVKKADLTALNTVAETFKFTQTLTKPSSYISKAVFNTEPPTETSTGKFSVEGTCDAGLRLVGTAMRMSSSEVLNVEATAGKTGKFSLDFQLPTEGVWLVTVTVFRGEEVGEEKVFHVTTYQSNLLSMNWTCTIPETLTSDTFTITGKTIKGTKVQCIVSGGTTYDKQVTVNGKGTFSFKINTANEGDYNIVVVLQKKGYEARRFTFTATRVVSESEMRERAKSSAVKPNYSTLVENIKKYTGKILTYKMYVKSVSRSGDEWVVLMARKLTGTTFKEIIAVTCTSDPGFKVGQQYRVYGTCTGTYKMESEDKYYPCMSLLYTD